MAFTAIGSDFAAQNHPQIPNKETFADAKAIVIDMEKTNHSQLPDAELDIMLILWRRGKPSLVSDIHRELQEKRPCTKPAVHILLDRLAAKGYVRVETVDAPVPYKLATPLVSEEEYCSAASESFISKLFHGSWQGLIANLVDAGKITDADLEEISEIVNRRGKSDDKLSD